MATKQRISIAVAAVIAVGIGAAALLAARPAETAPAKGTIRISGAWAMYPMVVTWAEVYKKTHPGVRIDVSAGGAGKGATDALSEMVEIGMVSRDIHPDEVKKGGWFVPAVKDAVFPTINEKNPLARTILTRGIKPAAFAGIWVTQKVKTWGQATGTTNRDPIHIFTRSDACGAAETWAKFLGKSLKQENLKGTGVYGDPGVAKAVLRDRLAVGYNNLNFAYDARSGRPLKGIRIAPIDRNANGKLDAAENFYGSKTTVLRAIQDGRYPSPPARYLNYLCKGKPKGAALDFVRWSLTEGQKYAAAAGYIPLTKAMQQAALKKLR